MRTLANALIALAVLTFTLAVISAVFDVWMLTTAEGWSRASANLALIAIALGLWFKQGEQ